MLTPQERSQIRGIIQSPQWKTIERVADLLIKKIQDNSPIRDNSDDTLKELYLNEGQVRGIRNFLQKLLDDSQLEV